MDEHSRWERNDEDEGAELMIDMKEREKLGRVVGRSDGGVME